MNCDRLVAALVVSVCSGSVVAGISQSTLVAPGGFVQAGADTATNGGIGWPGDDLQPFIVGSGSEFAEGLFAGSGAVNRSASAFALNLNNSCAGTAGMGYVLASAANVAPNANQSPYALLNAGWKETFVVSNPAHTGQAGVMQFTVNASGLLKAAGFAGSSSVRITAHKNGSQLLANALSNPGNSDLLSTDRQYGNWALSTAAVNENFSEPFSGTVTFAVPFTFGTTFDLGVYAWARAGMRSSSGVQGNSTASAENVVINWGGITNIYAGGVPVAGSTISSGTSTNWGTGVNPPDPCPADINGDNVVDDADFVLFAAAYNILDCADPAMPVGCPADLNSDGFVDDGDFVLFAAAYNDLLCP